MTDKPLITVLTPCYNAEKDIQQFINCILNQTYENIELILINDGSIDNTEKLILANKDILEQKCYKFLYKKQKNQGLGATINNGLKYVTGKYLTIPDYDDILYSEYLETKVNFMESNPNISLCFNSANIVSENDKNKIIGKLERKTRDDSKIIEDYIWCKDVLFAPITYCIKTEDFWSANSGKDIYPSREGQNWQMLLPLLYARKHGYIEKTLASYVVRADSHSRTHEKHFFKRNIEIFKILFFTITKIKLPLNLKLFYYNSIILRFIGIFYKNLVSKIIKTVFSVSNEYSNNTKHKVLTIFGIKMKFKIS